ncbi:uncharacterized protein LOC130989736 [Salvia miltiorrhiza]|uniref:uncharacterized protein LOC130989736 n=1 Tax=Salvia miltiorrhiza TaxID=226208 RepID=UPI0025AB8C81|nr:uncharacterized protein LOC130989736 [Salvia miltiorrhiza]
MGCYSGLVLSAMIILLALEHSSAVCDQGNLETESQKHVLLQSDVKFLLGRKMLQELDGKPVYMPGLEKSFPEVQTENNHAQAQLQHSQKSTLNDESKALLEAADEVANLMRKDYRGMARRKPPINNHVPKG